MTVVSVSAQNTRLDDAEAATDWGNIGGGAGGGLETDFKYQGSNCFARKGASAQRGIFLSDQVNTDISPTGTFQTVMFKVICITPGLLELKSVPGIRLEIGSGSIPATASVDFHFYDLHGSDTYPIDKSWLVVPIDPNVVVHRSGTTGTPVLTVADYFADRYDQTAASQGGGNQALDAVDVGAGLTLIGGDGADPDGVWQDFSDHDFGTTANRFGYVREIDGVTGTFVIFGKMVIATATATVFNDTGATLFFPDGLFAAEFSGIAVDLQTAATDVDFVDSNFFGQGTGPGEDTRPVLIVTGTLGDFKTDNCVFDSFGKITLTSACTIVNGKIINSVEVDVGTVVFEDNTISNAPERGMLLNVVAHNMLRTAFLNNQTALRIDTAGSYTLDGCIFTGSVVADVENSANATTVARYQSTGNVIAPRDADQAVGNGTIVGISQSFNPSPEGENLASAEFFVRTTGTPTGNMRANLYAINGTFGGGDDIPTGTALSQSDFVSVDTLDKAFERVWQVDDSVPTLVDETTDANSAANADWVIFPATEATADYIALGSKEVFDGITFDNANGTAGVAGVVIWEYWNGTAWTALANVTDGTTSFTATVADGQLVHWERPTDWAKRFLDASETIPLYYVRARITTIYTTNPIYDQGFVHRLSSFQFPDGFTLQGGASYVIALEYSAGDASNHILVAVDTSSPGHAGNMATLTGSTWTAVSGTDTIFRVAGSGRVTLSLINSSNPTTVINTGIPPGVVDLATSVTVTVTNIVANSQVIVEEDSTKLQIINDEAVSATAILYERFEGTGFENAWTVNGGDTIDEDFLTADLPVPAPSDWQVQCMEIVYDGGTTQIQHNFASNEAITYFGIELTVNAESLANNQDNQLWLIFDSPSTVAHRGRLFQDGSGDLFFRFEVIHDGASGTNHDFAMVLDRTYRLEVRWDTVADVYEVRVDGELQFNGVLTGSAATLQPDTIIIGAAGGQSDAAATIYFDKVAVNTVTWPWEASDIVTMNATFDFEADAAATLRVRRSGMGTRFLPFSVAGVITAAGLTFQAAQVIDPIAAVETKWIPD